MTTLIVETSPKTITVAKVMPYEELIRDDRVSITAAQHIEYKLRQMAPTNSLPVSAMHTCRFVNRYCS